VSPAAGWLLVDGVPTFAGVFPLEGVVLFEGGFSAGAAPVVAGWLPTGAGVLPLEL
jgi:hypothetical protein